MSTSELISNYGTREFHLLMMVTSFYSYLTISFKPSILHCRLQIPKPPLDISFQFSKTNDHSHPPQHCYTINRNFTFCIRHFTNGLLLNNYVFIPLFFFQTSYLHFFHIIHAMPISLHFNYSYHLKIYCHFISSKPHTKLQQLFHFHYYRSTELSSLTWWRQRKRLHLMERLISPHNPYLKTSKKNKG